MYFQLVSELVPMEPLLEGSIEVIQGVDSRVVDLVAELRGPLLTKLMNSVTGLGSATAGLVFLGLFYLANWNREFRVTLIGLALTGVIVGTLMVAVQRPYPPQQVCQTGGAETVATSFPCPATRLLSRSTPWSHAGRRIFRLRSRQPSPRRSQSRGSISAHTTFRIQSSVS